MPGRVVYYYQTFCGLSDILDDPELCGVTHIHLGAIHFGYNYDLSNFNQVRTPYIHLNDLSPYDPEFDNLWGDIQKAKEISPTLKIVLMVGGAGGAYSNLFQDYNTFYPLLKELITAKNIDGVDLDIEEQVYISNVKLLINDLSRDFTKKFIISMAPVQRSMVDQDTVGMGGFKYWELYKSYEGEYIDYFNVQCYGDFNVDTFYSMMETGYPANKLNMGMIYTQPLDQCLDTVKLLVSRNINIGGMYIWEYYLSPPSPKHPGEWAKQVSEIFKGQRSFFSNYCAIA